MLNEYPLIRAILSMSAESKNIKLSKVPFSGIKNVLKVRINDNR
jgi:hypothetical protein